MVGPHRIIGMNQIVRTELTARSRRVRASLALAAQAALAAGLAWFIAFNLLGHHQPYFAPISAVSVLAVSVGQRLRRAVEIVAGNAVGIALGEAFIVVVGRGSWQVSLVVFIAILVAVFAGGSPALLMQSASAGILVATIIPSSGDYLFSRFVDAVVGGSVGLGVMALLLPLNPLTVVSNAAGPLLAEMSTGLSKVAEALDLRDADLAQAGLDDLKDAEQHLTAMKDAIVAAREISTLAPLRWGKRGPLAAYVDGYDHLVPSIRNARVLARRTKSMILDEEDAPESLIAAVRSLADATGWLPREYADEQDPEATRAAAVRAVSSASEAYRTGLGFSGSVVVAQVRSMATDLLRAAGVDQRDAERLVRRAVAKAEPAPNAQGP